MIFPIMNIQLFDHVPDGLNVENLPLTVELQPANAA
jgi:hypothetical protein